MKFKIFCIFSLVLLLVLVVFLFRPAVNPSEYDIAQKNQLLETANGWILEIDIFNPGETGETYTFDLLIGNKPSNLVVSVPSKEKFTYIQEIRSIDLPDDGKVFLTIYDSANNLVQKSVYNFLKKGGNSEG